MKLLIVLLIFMGLFLGSLSILSNWEHCPRNMIPCASFCLQCDKRCNRIKECADGSDEYECAPRLYYEEDQKAFGLTNGVTIMLSDSDQYTIKDDILSYYLDGELVNKPLGCGALPRIQNGQLSLIDKDSSVDATANVICNDGYKSCDPQVRCYCSKVWGTAKCVPDETNGISCYSCNGALDNDNCTAATEICPHNIQSCETTIEWRGETFTISKGCKNPNAGNEILGCKRQGPKSVCKYQCEGFRCNNVMPYADCDTCGTHEDDADGQDNEYGCRKELGRCTSITYNIYRGFSLPLKSSGCKRSCVCIYDSSYRWIQERCPFQTLFNISQQRCKHEGKVECLRPGEYDCMKEHGICNQTVGEASPKILSGSGCKKYCECEHDQAVRLRTGFYFIPIYRWAQKQCTQHKRFDENIERCRPRSEVECRGNNS